MPITKEGISTNDLGRALARNIEERDKALATGKPHIAHPHQNSIDALRAKLEEYRVDPELLLKELTLETPKI